MKSAKNPLQLSGLGLGTFPFSHVFGKVTDEESKTILDTLLARGGTYIQTAPYYDGVETLLGKMLRDKPRDSYQLATLCIKNQAGVKSGKYDAILKQCEESLQRLHMDYLDLLMTCTGNYDDAPYEETMNALVHLKNQGKIKAIGVCNVTLPQLQRLNSTGDVDYVQNRLSLIDQESQNEVRAYCVEHGIGIIPYNIIEWGLLTSKMLERWELGEDDLRAQVLPIFKTEQKKLLYDWIAGSLKPIAEKYKTTIERLAIAWALSQPGVVTSPVGATSSSQIESSLQSLELVGKQELMDELQNAYEVLNSTVEGKHGMKLNEFLKNSYGTWK